VTARPHAPKRPFVIGTSVSGSFMDTRVRDNIVVVREQATHIVIVFSHAR
jgi:hypothetical protein